MDFIKYINQLEKPADFQPTGLTKEFYLDVIETCVDAYSRENIEQRISEYEKNGIDDPHAFCRLTSAIGLLIANGRKKNYYEFWIKMMDLCCEDLRGRSGDGRVDFSVKEILLAYRAMKSSVPEIKREQWHKSLSQIDPDKNYLYVIRSLEEKSHLHNINIYNMTGEYLREAEGMTDTEKYFKKHWPVQLENFDANGMYKDPNCPILYDLTTRCQIQIMLGAGYRGKFYEELDEKLKKAGLWTLFMQSAAYEFPYGGRSNQFLFNEALISANCEYEAVRYKKLGDLKLAGCFKRSAHLAALSVKRWLDAKPPRHIKNFYPVETLYGTEGYGYYDKYMVTLGCFIYIAYMFADDSIEEYTCPAEAGGFVFKTSEDFHKIFANCLGQSIEIDTKADLHYDSTGLGRYHKKGIPTELALSMPFPSNPGYTVSKDLEKKGVAIGPGWKTDKEEICFLSELSEKLEHSFEVLESNSTAISFAVHYSGKTIKGCEKVTECYTLDEHGLTIDIKLIKPQVNSIYFRVPVFKYNGNDISTVSKEKERVTVSLGDFKYSISSDGNTALLDELIGNRNGEYGVALISADKASMTVRLSLY